MPLAERLEYRIDAEDNTDAATREAAQNFDRLADRAVDDLQRIEDASDDLGDEVESTGSRGEVALGKLGAGFAALGGAGAIGDFVLGVAESAVEIGNLSEQTGLTVEVLSGLRQIAAENSVEFEALISSFRTVQDRLVDAGRGGGDATESLEALGLSITDLLALSPAEQFSAVAEAIAAIQDPTERAGAASILLGDDYLSLLSVMTDLTEQNLSLADAAEEAATLTADQVEAAEEAFEAWAQLRGELEAVAARAFPAVAAQIREVTSALEGDFSSLLTGAVSRLGGIPQAIGTRIGGALRGDDDDDDSRPGRRREQLPQSRGGTGGGRGGGAGFSNRFSQPIEVSIEVDGREIARSVSDSDRTSGRSVRGRGGR